MTLEIHSVHLLLAILLFFLVNWVGAHAISSGYTRLTLFAQADEAPAFNFVFRVAAPVVFVILSSGFWYAVGIDDFVKNAWLIAVYYVLFRWGFNIIVGRGRLLNWPLQLAHAGAIIILAYLVYSRILIRRQNVLPDFTTIANELWIVVLFFLYQTVNHIAVPVASNARRKRRYLTRSYDQYRQRYGSIIEHEARDQRVATLVYAILIYESFNRPRVYRSIERRVLHPLGVANTTGVMQLTADRSLTDEESVRGGARMIRYAFDAIMKKAAVKNAEALSSLPNGSEESPFSNMPEGEQAYRYRDVLATTAAAYNIRSDYAEEVMDIYDVLIETYFPQLAQFHVEHMEQRQAERELTELRQRALEAAQRTLEPSYVGG